MSLEFHELAVAEVIEETPSCRSFVFDVPEALRARFTYAAGQFLTFEIPWECFSVRRCYSLSSCPATDARPKVTVKRVEGGRVSNWMIDHLRVGDSIRARPPEGRFVLDPAQGDVPLVCYAAGSGITPVIALVKWALRTTSRRVTLLYANRHANDVIFRGELAAIERAFTDRIQIHHHLDDPAGYLDADAVRRLTAGVECGEHYVCGPEGFMTVVETALEAAAVVPSRVHLERFNSPVDPDRREAIPDVQGPTTEVPPSFVMRLGGRTHTVPYRRGLTLLGAAQHGGIRAPSSCEDGYCSSCLAQLVTGDVAMRACRALTARDVARGRILLCQALPTSGAHVEVDCDAVSFRAAGAAGVEQASLARRWVAGVLAAVLLGALLFLRSRA